MISIIREWYNSYLVTLKGHGEIITKQSFKERHKRKQWHSCSWVLPRGSSMREVWPGRKYKACLRDQALNREQPAVPAELKRLRNTKDHRKSVTLKTKDLTRKIGC